MEVFRGLQHRIREEHDRGRHLDGFTMACRISFRFSHLTSSQRTVLLQRSAFALALLKLAFLASDCLLLKTIRYES